MSTVGAAAGLRGRTGARIGAVVGLVAALVLSACAARPLPPDVAAAVTQPNATAFTSVDGEVIQAHGGGVLKHDGVYYWVGENRGTDDRFRYVSLYRSTDLVNWTFASNILAQESDPELATATVERPKLLYNEATETFVLWMHWENGVDYSEARVAVATSPTVDGRYEYQGSFRPLGFESRDMTVFADDDGTAYLASATAGNADIQLYRLDASYTSVEEPIARLWPGAFREAPALFERDGIYFLLTSGATGWNPNQARYATATSIRGPWSELQDVGDGSAFGSQAAFVLPVTGDAGTDFLYLGDRWAGAWGGKVNDSEYVWLPLEFSDAATLSLHWADALEIDVARGRIHAATSGDR